MMEYPGDFWIMAVSGLMLQAMNFGFLAVLFTRIDTVAGWSYHEMLVLSGFISVVMALVEGGWDGVWTIGRMVVEGDLDYRITRPAPVSVQIGSSAIGMQAFGNLTAGLAMAAYGWIGAGIGFDPVTLAVAVPLFASAVAIQASYLTILNGLGFWLKGRYGSFAYAAVQLQHSVGRYPMSIYPAAIRAAFTVGLPFAFVNFIPAQILTGRVPLAWAVLPPIAAAALVGLSALVLRLGLRSYDSAGH
ncbi:ABC transporter permease [Glycomyces sp. A-F 0318]|uniref:ABC transporter permease n=1 Tax=Glycomyces amatae TaxID=2881355 RepID=UPI001E568153|nr:ABC-2 family transporter protein [Glycomyces amatae]MCD0444884.1 ABC transporter permease [Glycomyces amatae]